MFQLQSVFKKTKKCFHLFLKKTNVTKWIHGLKRIMTSYHPSHKHMGNEISVWLNAFNLVIPGLPCLKAPHDIWEHPFSARSYLFHLLAAEPAPEKDERLSLFKYTICKWHRRGRPQRLSHEEDTLVNNSGLITVKTHHQMYFILLYGCHSLTFIYHFLVVGQWNGGFEIKSAMIHVSAVSVLH